MSAIKVLGISGSPRKGRNTEKLLYLALEAAGEAGASTELISLAELNIRQCVGCNTCVREKRCPLDDGDDMALVKGKLLEANAVVFAAPSYFGSVPGVMKNAMDRSRSLKMDGHRLAGKVASALSLSGLRHGGAEQVAESIARFGLMHGMIVVGGCGDPLSSGHFGVATLQADEGWRRAEEDAIAVANARGVGRRVAEVALALKASEQV
ncbi:MAG: flavodoxin family protein [Candidatus Bathyarchaeota archaeon]|nr:flavodoxin family protein [Candidatus Bathyarchaeota archaeon]MDH5791556.1 flavodoxin family protein [Candidatus Bathyarchaeota archaeon]